MSEATKPKMPLRRRLLWIGGGCAVLLAVIAVAGYAWLNSASFESLVRRRLAAQLEQATGGRVEIGSFHWRLMDLEASLGGLVIHGREAANEAPYARVDEMHVRVSILNVLSPRILLRELVIRRPELHLIIYADGTTNQPRPKRASTNGRQMLNTLFDLKAGQVAVEQGLLDYDNRAAQFDAQNRHLPLDFAARDVSALLRYVPAAGKPAAAGKNPESYHVELGARDFRLTRGDAAHQSATAQAATAVEGYLQATLDVERNEAFLRSLRVTASGKGIAERTLTIAGSLDNFARPHWKATAQGELDMRLLEPLTGYANSPEGVARVDLNGEGHGGQFRVDGPIHVDGGSYVGGGVYARGVDLDAHVHADPEQLLIAQVVARLKQGGRLEGTVALDHWLPPLPGEAQLGPAAAVAPAKRHWFFSHGRKTAPVATVEATNAPITIPVNGKVTAQLKDVSIDTVMNIVGKGPFERLGVDARLNGPATATWIKGDVGTLAVGATLLLSPSAHTPAGESPATGTIDATYTQRDGAVDLRALEVAMPGSRVDAHGHLGAYPLSSPSSIAIDVRTQNLGEFDRVLRDLGLQREGKSGAAALPATLGGQAEFHGMWSGSLLDPHLAGTLTAKDVSIEAPGSTAPAQKAIHFDSIDAAGSYSAARIALDRGQFKERGAEVSVEGSLSAAAAEPALKVTGRPQFDGSSLLRARVMASKVSAAELLSALGQSLPVTGEVSAQLETDGPLRALAGSGWAELDNGEVYGEPLARVRAQG
ncbi:MAG TPA: hypothetical protein VE291_00050, partial [Terracidiphilus sp.]|nr:hypothetical protein [Terracidiphilus sp.]